MLHIKYDGLSCIVTKKCFALFIFSEANKILEDLIDRYRADEVLASVPEVEEDDGEAELCDNIRTICVHNHKKTAKMLNGKTTTC